MKNRLWTKELVYIIIGLLIWMSLLNGIGSSKTIKDFTQINTNLPTTPPVIMCTGFWNPTGLMLTSFSTDPELNPTGWEGENWEGFGYNIYSYFPKPGDYTGMFEVDYQDTWDDFWNVTNQLHPFAIISFGAGAGPWEIEYNARNLNSWIKDEKTPFQPTPNPPDNTEPVGFIRHSSLPVQQIADAVNNQTTIDAWVDWDGNPGAYLCEYIAYLGMWYQNTHNATTDSNPCRAAGFIHVNAEVDVAEAIKATKITLRETIKYLSDINTPPNIPTITGETNGVVKTSYDYTIKTTDPEQSNVQYFIDWGDTTNSGWIGPYSSGQTVTVSHSWDSEGTFNVKVKAKDTNGKESDWAALTVTMPRSFTKPILHLLESLIEWFPSAPSILRHLLRH